MYMDKVSCDSLVVVTRLQVLFGKEHICYRRTACWWAILMKSELHLKFCYSCRDRVQRLHSRCLPLGTIRGYHLSWFSSDVTKIQTPKSQELLRFHLHLAKDLFKRNFCASFQLGMNGVFRFENIAFSNFPSLIPRDLIWRPRRPSHMLKNNFIAWYYGLLMVKALEKYVYGNNLLVRGEQLIKFVAILKPDVCIISGSHI